MVTVDCCDLFSIDLISQGQIAKTIDPRDISPPRTYHQERLWRVVLRLGALYQYDELAWRDWPMDAVAAVG